MHACKIWDNDLTEYQVWHNVIELKRAFRHFHTANKKKCSKEHLVIILTVKESFERFSCLEFILEKANTGKPALNINLIFKLEDSGVLETL